MEKEINFFGEYRTKIKKSEKKKLIIQVSSIVILSLYFVVVLGIILSLFYLKSQENNLAEKIKKTESEIESLRSIETKQVYLAEKIKSLEQIFGQKKEHQKIAKSLFSLLPSGIAVNGFAINEEGQAEFTANAKSFSSLKQFFSNIYSSEQYSELPIRSVDINSFDFRRKTGYAFNIKIGFLKE